MAWGRVCDAVLVARDLHNHFEKNGGLVTLGNKPKAIQVNPQLLKIADFRQSKILGHLFRTRVQRSRDLIQLQGIFRRYQHGAIISLNHSLNVCWTRMVLCKEIMHLYCDMDETHFATDIVAQLSAGILRNMPKSPGDEIESEDAAVIAAFEFLYPWSNRLKTTDKPTATRFHIADTYKIPEWFIDMYFLSGYGVLSEQTNQDMVCSV